MMMMDYKEILNKINLRPDQILEHLAFLRYFDENQVYLQDNVLKQAIHRYEKYWIPLIQSQSQSYEEDLEFSPPLDIHWVWHVHMLAPQYYQHDLLQSPLQRIISHKPSNPASVEAKTKRARTASVWRKLYPDEPFEIDVLASAHGSEFSSSFTYDIVTASSRQKVFFYQVSLPQYQDKSFLSAAVSRYSQFLFLKQKAPDKFLVPCYDIDIVWHTHQSNPVKYSDDTNNLFGKLFNHDDSVNDRSEGSKLSNASQETAKLWRETFNEDFRKPGCMYRGGPPQGHLLHLSKEDQMGLINTKVASLKLSNIKCYNFQYSTRAKIETFVKLKHSSQEFPGTRQITCSNLEGKLSLRQGF